MSVTIGRDRSRALVLLLAWLTTIALTTVYAAGWPTDNRVARWVGQLGDQPGFRVLAERFDGDEFVLVRIHGVDLDSAEDRQQIGAARRELAAQPAVLQIVDALALPGVPLNGGRLAVANDPIVRALDLVDPRGERLDLLLGIESGAAPAQRLALARSLEELRSDIAARGWTLRAAGHPLVAAALDAEAQRVERTFAPILLLLAAVAATVFLRSLGLALVVMLPAALAATAPRAALRWLGLDSDLILVVLGPLCFVIVFASMLHLGTAYARHRAALPPAAARRAAVREKLPAGLLAAATTAIGLLAFLLSELPSVVALGLTSALSVLVTVPLGFALVPPLFGAWEGASRRLPTRAGGPTPWRRLAVRAIRARPLVILVALLVMGLGGAGAMTLPRSTNALHYFPEGERSRADFLAIEADGRGLSTADVLVRRADGQPWEVRALLDCGLEQALAKVAGTEAVIGPATVAPLAERIPLLGAATVMQTAGRLDDDRTWARWTVQFPTQDGEPTRAIVDELRRAVSEWQQNGAYVVHVTGSVPAMLASQEALIATLASSLTFTAILTTLCFLFVTRRPRDLLAALLTNLFPVGTALAAAWLLGTPLDGATAVVAAVVLALAVDNTFHLLHAARSRRSGGDDRRSQLRAFDRVGRAAFVSSIALALGFLALAFSGFAPTARFGLLCAIGMAAAFVADLVVLPAAWWHTR